MPAQAIAGMPAAAGGVDVSTALTSIVPGIRKLKRIATTAAIPVNGGRVQLDLPKASYWQKGTIRITGTLRIVQPGGGAVTVTATDARLFVQSVSFSLSGTTAPRQLTGIQHDIIDNLDVPVVQPNTVTYTAGPAGAAGSTTDTAFVLELSPRLTVSDQNLYGIPYLGAPSSVPQLVITFGDPQTTLATFGGAGAVATMQNGLVELEMWRVDLPGPVAPQRIPQQKANGEVEYIDIPGQGLYHESSYILLTKMFQSFQLGGASAYWKFRLPIGPDYLRLLLLSWTGLNTLDPETSPLILRAELIVQQATTLESKTLWQASHEYKETYYKTRPSGVIVFSGIDLTGSDADLYVTRELGNFDLDVYGTTNAPPANSRWECLTQQLVLLSQPGQYL